jgi:hypothetical protein
MKILGTVIQNNIVQNLYHTLSMLGHNVYYWNPAQTSLYGVVDKLKPDLFFSNNELTSNTLEAIKEYNIPTVTFGITLPFEQQKLICTFNTIPETILSSISKPYYVCLPAANILHNIDNTLTPFDILYVCHPPMAHTTLTQLENLNQSFNSLKIVGSIQAPYYSYIGHTTIEETLSLSKVARLTIINNLGLLYDFAFYDSFLLTNHANNLYPLINHNTDLLSTVKHYLDSPKLVNKIKKAAKTIAKNNTYHHRLIDIFNLLNYTTESQTCQNSLLKVLES